MLRPEKPDNFGLTLPQGPDGGGGDGVPLGLMDPLPRCLGMLTLVCAGDEGDDCTPAGSVVALDRVDLDLVVEQILLLLRVPRSPVGRRRTEVTGSLQLPPT